MKRILFFVLTVVAALILISEFRLSRTEAPPAPTIIRADCDIEFTVKTDSGSESVNMADYLPGVLAGEMPFAAATPTIAELPSKIF